MAAGRLWALSGLLCRWERHNYKFGFIHMASKRWVDRQCKEKMMWCRAVGCIVTLTLSLLAAPLTVTAQPRSTVPRIGILAPGTITQVANTFWEPFLHGLRDLGYVEGQNIVLEYRFAAG